MRLLSLALVLALTPSIVFADSTQCPYRIEYPSGMPFKEGRNYYHPNGSALIAGDEVYYASGAPFKIGTSLFYANGKPIQQDGGDHYYPDGTLMRHFNGWSYDYYFANGRPLKKGDVFYYRSGAVARQGGKLFHEDGSLASGKLVLTERVAEHGSMEATVYADYDSVYVIAADAPPVGVPATGITPGAEEKPQPTSGLRLSAHWPELNYRPTLIITYKPKDSSRTVHVDMAGTWVTCNVSYP